MTKYQTMIKAGLYNEHYVINKHLLR